MTSNLTTFYVDASVVLRALLGHSPAAKKWWEKQIARGTRIVGSQMVAIEVHRVVRRQGGESAIAEAYLREFNLHGINSEIVADAINLKPVLSGADSIHIATCGKLNNALLTLATHDKEMAEAAMQLGINIVDPVTDDPNRGPVA
jgi:hypothetical protein